MSESSKPHIRVTLMKVAFAILLIVPILYLGWTFKEKMERLKPKDASFEQYPINLVELSVDEAEHAVALDTSYINLLELGMAYYKNNMNEKGIKVFKQAVKLNPKSTYGFLKICELYNRIGIHDSAITNCDKALYLKPGYELAKYQIEVAQHRKAGEENWQ